MSAPSNTAVASAIIEVCEARTIAAWRYLDAWSSLTSAGMLGEDATYALDVEPLDTIPVVEIAKWQRYGARGLIVLTGAKDSGKTYAAARWGLERHREGESFVWVRASSFGGRGLDELRGVMRKAGRADALVFDDAGAGTMGHGDYFASMLEGLLLERGQRPTIVSGNMNAEEMAAWLGPRVTSRQRQAGGLVYLAKDKKLRTRSSCDDKLGRSSAWFEAEKIVSLVGCDRDRRWVSSPEFEAYLRKPKTEAWEPWPLDEPEGEYRDTFLVGQTLMEWSTRGNRRLREASDALGLDRDAVRARALELDASTPSRDMSIDQRLKDQQIQMKLAAVEDNMRRSKVCYDALYGRGDDTRTREARDIDISLGGSEA